MVKKNEINDLVLKAMPRNLDAEAAVLGGILIDNIVAGEIFPELNEEQFFSDANRTIFLAMRKLQAQGNPIDLLTVSDYLEKQGKLRDVGNMSYISKLTSEMPSAANIDFYVSLIERDSLLRKIIRAGVNISELGYHCDDAAFALDKAQQIVFEIIKEKNKTGLVHIEKAATKVLDNIERQQRGEKIDRGIQSGFENLDQIIGGFKPGTYSLIAARPSVGKTAFALSIAANAVIYQKKRVAVFNMEMTDMDIANRILTNMSGVPYSVQKLSGGMRPSQTQDLSNAYVKLINSLLYIDDNADNSPAKIMSKCRKLALAEGGLDLVIVDYLGLMTTGDRPESRQQEVSNMSRMMKICSKELSVPMVVLAQLNRAGEARGGKPQLIDLRESGSIEQDADIVMFLQRYDPERVNPFNKEAAAEPAYQQQNVIELFIEKNRNGRCGKVAFEWTGDLQRFDPIATPDNAEFTAAPKKIELAAPKGGSAFKDAPATLPKEISDLAGSVPIGTQPAVDVPPFNVKPQIVDDFISESDGAPAEEYKQDYKDDGTLGY